MTSRSRVRPPAPAPPSSPSREANRGGSPAGWRAASRSRRSRSRTRPRRSRRRSGRGAVCASLNVPRPCTYFTLRCRAELAEPSGEAFDDALLPAAQRGQVDLGRAELDAPLGRSMRLVDQAGDVQQRLRGDAAAIEADAARLRRVVDERDVHAEVGGVEGGGVAARSAPSTTRRVCPPNGRAP